MASAWRILLLPFPQAKGRLRRSSGLDAAATPSQPPLRCAKGEDGIEPEADAAVTSTPGTVLAILTADCLPVVFAARDGTEVAAAHAGWRTGRGVLEATVAAMRLPADRLLAGSGRPPGPALTKWGRRCSRAFVSRDAGASAMFAPTRPGHWNVDLYSLARRRLAAIGVADVHGGDVRIAVGSGAVLLAPAQHARREGAAAASPPSPGSRPQPGGVGQQPRQLARLGWRLSWCSARDRAGAVRVGGWRARTRAVCAGGLAPLPAACSRKRRSTSVAILAYRLPSRQRSR